MFDARAAVHLYESPLSKDQQIDELPDKRVRVVATVADTRQLLWWLSGFAEKVEVVRPVELRNRMAASTRRLAEMYGVVKK